MTEVPGTIGRLRFSHALVRDALYEDLPTARRARLHREIGEALEGLYADDPGPHLAELAFQVPAERARCRLLQRSRQRVGDVLLDRFEWTDPTDPPPSRRV